MKFLVYLSQQGILTGEQVVQVLTEREAHRVPFGRLAFEAGLLDEDQVSQISAHIVKTSERFGEACIARGLLTRTQLWALLGEQEDRLPDTPTIIAQVGLYPSDEIDTFLETYRRLQFSGIE